MGTYASGITVSRIRSANRRRFIGKTSAMEPTGTNDFG